MGKRIRQYIGIFAAVIAYYFVHEGAHLVAALHYGTFKKINFMGLGMQIDAYTDRMTHFQLGIFCLAGAVSTVLIGWLLVLLCKRICTIKSKVLKTAMWYISLSILLIDPLYLSILCGFFGGGDMNGISLLVPELAARIVYGLLLPVNAAVFIKVILPRYKRAFQAE